MPHFWTLAIKEQFYLVWPWAMLFLPRRWLVPFLLTLCCLGPAWRLCASFHNSPHDWSAAYTFTPGIVDFLAIGAVLAIAAHAHQSSEKLQRTLTRVVLPIGAVIYVSLFWVSRSVDHHAPLALESTGAALVFCWLIGSASRGFVRLPGLPISSRRHSSRSASRRPRGICSTSYQWVEAPVPLRARCGGSS